MGVVPEKLPGLKLPPKLSPNILSAAGVFSFCYTRPKRLCSLFVSCCFFTSEPLRCCRCVARSPLPAPLPLFIFLGLTWADPTLTKKKKTSLHHTHIYAHTASSSQCAACFLPCPCQVDWQLIIVTDFDRLYCWQRVWEMERAVHIRDRYNHLWETGRNEEKQKER